jgi:hypothetical protein
LFLALLATSIAMSFLLDKSLGPDATGAMMSTLVAPDEEEEGRRRPSRRTRGLLTAASTPGTWPAMVSYHASPKVKP